LVSSERMTYQSCIRRRVLLSDGQTTISMSLAIAPPTAPVESERNDSKLGESWSPPYLNSNGPESAFNVYGCSEHNLSVTSLHWIAYLLNQRSFA
jgi:hypothetical protein